MLRHDESERLGQTIKDAEIRIKTMQSNILSLDKELSHLMVTEATLLENIKCLKTNQIIAIVQEFKKSKEELAKTRNRINVLRIDKGVFNKDIKNMEITLFNAHKHLEKLKTISDNVLTFTGKKNG